MTSTDATRYLCVVSDHDETGCIDCEGIYIRWREIEAILGHPHGQEDTSADDEALVAWLMSHGAPAWAADAPGSGGMEGWWLMGPAIKWDPESRPDWDSTGTVEEAYSATLSDGREVTVYRTGTEWAWFDGHGHSEGPYRTRAQAADACMRESGS